MNGRVPTALALAGIAFGLFLAWGYAQADASPALVAWDLAVGWAYIGAGLVAWRRRPANRLGPLLAAAGFAWFLPGLQGIDVPLLRPIGLWFRHLHSVILIHLILAFPIGNLSSWQERLVVRAGYGWSIIGGFMRVATYDPSRYPIWAYSSSYVQCPSCGTTRGATTNALLLYSNPAVFEALIRILQTAGAVVSLLVLGMVIRRWRTSSGPTRRALTPVWLSTAVFAVPIVSTITGQTGVLSRQAGQALRWTSHVGRLAIPVVFLLGLLRMRLARAGVGELMIELEEAPPPAKLREVLARTLKDSSLEVVFWLPEAQCYVDLEGRAVRLPDENPQRAVTLVQREGQPLAAMIHDPALADEHELVQAVAAAARLGLENEQLETQVRKQLEDVRASRVRIVAAADAERRRVERDLHDGAQQRLVSLSLSLRLAQMQLGDHCDPELRAALTEASEQLQGALCELRELARGIHPAILTQQGLSAAVESLAEQTPIPLELALPSGRYPTPVETTAYFVVCEALANVTKYAKASRARIAIEQVDGQLIVQVVDDGAGGANPARGTGLSGLADRVAALGGQLRVISPEGAGTCVRAELPCR